MCGSRAGGGSSRSTPLLLHALCFLQLTSHEKRQEQATASCCWAATGSSGSGSHPSCTTPLGSIRSLSSLGSGRGVLVPRNRIPGHQDDPCLTGPKIPSEFTSAGGSMGRSGVRSRHRGTRWPWNSGTRSSRTGILATWTAGAGLSGTIGRCPVASGPAGSPGCDEGPPSGFLRRSGDVCFRSPPAEFVQ